MDDFARDRRIHRCGHILFPRSWMERADPIDVPTMPQY
jgi:hypothetical protein